MAKNAKPKFNGPYYVTKYALTKGVQEYETARVIDGDRISLDQWGGGIYKPDWHTDSVEASRRVLVMIEAKRRSIAKTLAKLDRIGAEHVALANPQPGAPDGQQ